MPSPKPRLGEEFIPVDESAGILKIAYSSKEALQQVIRSADKPIPREQHPKQFGCVWAEFTVEPDLPDYLREGIFKAPKTFQAWIRFSSRKEQFDPKGDVSYGMAIKLMDVTVEDYGKKILNEEENAETQDFLMIDYPVFFIKNVSDYVISRSESNELVKPLRLAFQLAPFKIFGREIWIVAGMFKNKVRKIKNPLELRYWSAVPYRLGLQPVCQPWSTSPHEPSLRAIKFFVKPRLPHNRLKTKIAKSENYLRETLAAVLSQQDAYFDFYVQLQADPERHPIEDPRRSWRGTPEYKVATIRIPAQAFDTAEQHELGEQLSFTPWHALPEHRPLGGVNRARRDAYRCSSLMRNQANRVERQEPTVKDSENFKRLITAPRPQQALTVLVPLKSEVEVEEFKQFLQEKAELLKTALRKQSLSTHFARWVVLYNEDTDDLGRVRIRGIKSLLFTSNYDGDLEAYLEELRAVNEDSAGALNQIWNHCETYQDGMIDHPAHFLEFVQTHRFQEQVFGAAFAGQTVQMICNNQQARRLLDELLDVPAVQHQIGKLQTLLWQRSPSVKRCECQPTVDRPLARFDDYLVPIFNRIVGIQAGHRAPDKNLHIEKQIRQLQANEDKTAQNELTIFVPVKPTLWSWFLLRFALFLTQRRIDEQRSSILKLKTIHFARWAMLSKKRLGTDQRYLLFESNYNGTWDGYISAFIEAAGPRLDGIFGNCIEYPTGGAEDENWFKQHIRNYQFPAQIFYSAYPDLTVKEIGLNAEIGNVGLDFLGQPGVQQFMAGAYNLLS